MNWIYQMWRPLQMKRKIDIVIFFHVCMTKLLSYNDKCERIIYFFISSFFVDDKNRVILDCDSDGADYINASFINVSFVSMCLQFEIKSILDLGSRQWTVLPSENW